MLPERPGLVNTLMVRRNSKEARAMISGLGYAGFGSDKLEDWQQF